MSAPTVWALVHDLGRSGVPVALLRMVRWQQDSAVPGHLHVVAGQDGPLRPAFEALGVKVVALTPEPTVEPRIEVGRALRRASRPTLADRWDQATAARAVRDLPRADSVLIQGLGAWAVWSSLRPSLDPRVRVITHVHELEIGLERSVPEGQRQRLLAGSHAVLAVAEPSRQLAIRWGARPSTTTLVPGSVDEAGAPRAAGPIHTVVGMGEAGWRKGTDRFLAVAREVTRRHPAVTFAWVGAELPPAERWAVDAELPVRWDGEVDEPWALLGPGTLLLLPSREDPLPLVVLEAGARGLPVVAASTGGVPALLSDGRGIVVASHDLVAMSGAVARAIEDPRAAAQLGARLRDHVNANHATAVVGPRWAAAVFAI